jgi:hypothetical protein
VLLSPQQFRPSRCRGAWRVPTCVDNGRFRRCFLPTRARPETADRLAAAGANPRGDTDQAFGAQLPRASEAQNVVERVNIENTGQDLPSLITSEVIGRRAFVS